MIDPVVEPTVFGELERRWNISSAFLIAQTDTSSIYRITQIDGQIAIVKRLKPSGLRELTGADYLRWANGNGAVHLLDLHGHTMLLEDAGVLSLTDYRHNRGEELATEVVARVIEALHGNLNEPPSSLLPLEQHFQALLEVRTSTTPCADALDFCRVLARDLLSQQSDIGPLHGDLHHENILYSDARSWLAIDPQGLIGERVYDCANIFGNPKGAEQDILNPERVIFLATRFAALFRCSQEKVLHYAIAHAGLSIAWHLEDESRIEQGSDAAQRLDFVKCARQILAERF